MKKFVIIIIITSVLFFSIGLSVGVFKFFPYSQLDLIKKIILNESSLETKYVMNDFIYNENIDSLIYISTPLDVEKKRNELIKFIWNQNMLPDYLPTNIQYDIEDSRFSLQNLEQIVLIEHKMEFGINSISYLFLPEKTNNKLIIYHQGHGGDFIKGEKTIQFLLKEGFSVIAFSMPLLGNNDKPIVHTEEFGTIILNSHDHLKYLESENLNPLKFFFEPISVSINYMEKNYDFDEYIMIGISGGAWTSMYYSAIDDRISDTYPVAGPYPLFIRSNYNQLGDYETENTKLLSIVNELEAYIMGAYGKDRKFVQIYNKYDSCCWDGEYFEIFKDTIKEKISELGVGYYDVMLDDTHQKHIISEYALELITNSIDDD